MTGTYKMAGKVIEVTSLYEDVHRYCADYRCEGEPDITVKITQEDIDYERERSARTDEVRERKPLHAPDHLLERLAVYRRIAETAPQYGIFLFHGSCVAVDGQGYLFTAASGTGKSTHTRLHVLPVKSHVGPTQGCGGRCWGRGPSWSTTTSP